MSSPAEILARYISDPESFWDGIGRRQSDKLIKSLKQASHASGLDWDGVREAVITAALERATGRPPPLYLVNIGGSGSHWLGLMLAELEGLVDAAEVYFPPPLLEIMREELSLADQAVVVDGIHLLHAWARSRDWEKATVSAVVNSAHRPDMIGTYREWDPGAKVVHLYRDPRDRVLSVTYRKMAFRAQDAPEMSDEAYLRSKASRNVSYLRRYLTSNRLADMELAYERIRANPTRVLTDIADLVDLHPDLAAIEEAVFRHDESNIRAGVVESQGNLHEDKRRGWSTAAERDRLILHHTLAFAIDVLGYAHDDCLARDEIPATTNTPRSIAPLPGVRYDHDSDGSGWVAVENGQVPANVTLRARLTEAGVEALDDVLKQPVDILCAAGLKEFANSELTRCCASDLRGLDISGTGVTADTPASDVPADMWIVAHDSSLESWAAGLPGSRVTVSG